MSYLDVSPMMTALRQNPQRFELSGEWLIHSGSWHSFRFGPGDQVEIHAACNCSLLAVRPDQLPALSRCFRDWETNYWRPLQINREFASHFSPPQGLRGILIAMTGRLHGWLVRAPRAHRGVRTLAQTH